METSAAPLTLQPVSKSPSNEEEAAPSLDVEMPEVPEESSGTQPTLAREETSDSSILAATESVMEKLAAADVSTATCC